LRAVTAATAAAILQVDRKAFDNLLLRIGEDALPRGRQGVERRIPVALIEDLLLARDLSAALSIPAREAFGIARRLLGRSPSGGEPDLGADFIGSLPVGDFIHLGADISALRLELQARLEAAVEAVVRRPRGRPPRSRGPRAAPEAGVPSALGDA
jgi:hypothetical protein